jgi:hypothetical protein
MFAYCKGTVHRTFKYSTQRKALLLQIVSKRVLYTFTPRCIFIKVYLRLGRFKGHVQFCWVDRFGIDPRSLSDEDATGINNGTDVPGGIKSYHRNGTTKLFQTQAFTFINRVLGVWKYAIPAPKSCASGNKIANSGV